MVRDAARGLGFAHAQGVVHRDVKPENILVGSDGRVRVTDFGLAALEGGQALTRTGTLLGTPHYMSPEQFAGAKLAEVDARADVWALGVCLYEVTAGERPFEGETLLEIGGAISNARYALLSEVADQAPPALDAVLGRALARAPADRFSDGQEFAPALDRLLEGQGVAGASLRPRALVFGATGALCALALGAAALSSWGGQELPPPTPADTLPPSPVVSPPSEDLAAARRDAAAGQVARALQRSASFSTPAGRTLHVELLLQAGSFSEAASAISRAPPAEAPRLEALRILLSSGDAKEALLALGEPKSPQAVLVQAVASFLVDPKSQLELPAKWIPHRDLVSFARGEVARLEANNRDPTSYFTRAGSYKGDLEAARTGILERSQLRELYRGEVLLARRDLPGAAKVHLALARGSKPAPPELPYQFVYLALLSAQPERAKELLAQLPPGATSTRLPWRGAEATRALLEGRGWSPGQK